jgi:hypothetical protein
MQKLALHANQRHQSHISQVAQQSKHHSQTDALLAAQQLFDSPNLPGNDQQNSVGHRRNPQNRVDGVQREFGHSVSTSLSTIDLIVI